VDIKFNILSSSGGSKGAALLALLAGLYIVTQMRQQQRASAGMPRN
jgi:hypothetical protein